MDMRKVTTLTAHYKNMNEDEIALLHANPNLTDEARLALNNVISTRKIDLATIRQEDAEEQFQIDESRKRIVAAKEKRNASFLKWLFIIGIPIVILGAIFRPERAIETLISTAMQGALILVLAWIISSVKRKKDKICML